MSSVKRRRNKRLNNDEITEVETFIHHHHRTPEEEKKHLFSQINVEVKPKTENQKKLIHAIKKNEITIASGLPGSGKTFLSCAEALKMLKNPDLSYKKIILVKSVTTLKDEEIGFLKGTMEEKMEPFMDSFLDNFHKIIGEYLTGKLREHGYIQIKPIAYVRGRSIDDSIIIIDEAQNINLDNMRTLMTRIGDNSKMVVLGDVKQKDIKNKKESSLEIVLNRFKDKPKFGTVELRNKEDIVRNPIIEFIEEVFDQIDEDRNNKTLLPKQILNENK